MRRVSDLNIASNIPLPAPALMLHEIPRSMAQEEFVAESRQHIHDILLARRSSLPADRRTVFDPRHTGWSGICNPLAETHGPCRRRSCSLSCAAISRSRERPTGWKGLIMDPHLDNSDDIPEGLRIARRVLRDIIDLGVPTATELLDPITPQYIADLICWSAIGARTTGIADAPSDGFRTLHAAGIQERNARARSFRPSTPSRPRGSRRHSWGSAATAWPRRYRPPAIPTAISSSAGATTGRTTPRNTWPRRSGSWPMQVSKEPWSSTAVMGTAARTRIASPKSCGTSWPSDSPAPVRSSGPCWRATWRPATSRFRGRPAALVYGQSITDACIDWDTTERIVLETAERW